MKRFTSDDGRQTFAEPTGTSPTPTLREGGVRPEKYGLSEPVASAVDVERGPMTEQEKHQEDLRVIDAVWGELKEGGPNYRNLGW